MSSHFSIIIQDENGVKQFNLHNIIKKASTAIIVFLIFMLGGAISLIIYLSHSVDTIEKKLSQKKKELIEVSDSLSEIETLMGISVQNDLAMEERFGIAKLNSEHLSTLMQFIPSGSPIEYNGINSEFGYRFNSVLNKKEYHLGLDLKAKVATPVYATADGIVEIAKFDAKGGYGNLVTIQHNYGFKTYYAHLSKISTKAAAFVKKGDLIGYSGNTGLSSGPHLHYEIRFIQRVLNPIEFVRWGSDNYIDIFEKEKSIPWQELVKITSHIKVQSPTQKPPVLRISQK